MPAGPADVQRWSEEVAQDPGAPAFVPLARTYRRQGRPDAALRVLLRGLERNPTHVEGHTVLALVYLERGEREKAWDEWATALRLDPSSFEANRGIGFLQLEQGAWDEALQHLEAAAAARPEDGAVQDALRLARAKREEGDEAPGRERGPEAAAPAPARRRDPARLFELLETETPFLGALLLDPQGLVLAGRIGHEDERTGEMLGAVLGGALDEASRAAEHLELGRWKGLMLESGDATIHIAPAAEDASVLLAARHGAPAGWVVRTARRAGDLARAFLEGRA